MIRIHSGNYNWARNEVERILSLPDWNDQDYFLFKMLNNGLDNFKNKKEGNEE